MVLEGVRIVVITIEPPDPFGNAASRWFYVLFKGLVERGHEVTLLSSYRDEESRAHALEHFPAPHYDLRCFPTGGQGGLRGKLESAVRPYSYVFSPAMRSEAARLLAQPFDVLHLEQLWSGWLGWRHAQKAILNIHYLFSQDLRGIRAKGTYDALRRQATFLAERRILKHFPHLATLTPRLVEEVRRLGGPTPALIPLGIDPALYSFSADDPLGPPTLGLIGNFAWQPTHRAGVRLLTELWPRIKALLPDTRLLIVGRDAERFMRPHVRDPEVELHENVPDILPYFRRMHTLLYAPEHGTGTKVKVQESMALGIPVVTNTDGAEGIPAHDGIELAMADDNDGLVERTVALLRDSELRRHRRVAARALLEKAFGPAATLPAVEAAYAALLPRRTT